MIDARETVVNSNLFEETRPQTLSRQAAQSGSGGLAHGGVRTQACRVILTRRLQPVSARGQHIRKVQMRLLISGLQLDRTAKLPDGTRVQVQEGQHHAVAVMDSGIRRIAVERL